jgi:peptidoglycan/LPS O-acetylase OafA/YrhL
MSSQIGVRLSAFIDRILGRLARVTSSGAFYPEIDGLRAIAILAVVAFHVQKYVPHAKQAATDGSLSAALVNSVEFISRKGFFGVELFFVISGFILSLPFATYYLGNGRRPSLARYYQRRVLRLEPPYIISLLVCFALLTLAYGASARHLLPHLAASLVYVRQLVLGGDNPINGVLWSLECEVQFYVLAPLLAKLFLVGSKSLRRICFLAIPIVALGLVHAGLLLAKVPHLEAIPVLGVLLRAFAPISLFLDRIIVLHYTGYFCAGFLLSDFFVVSWKGMPAKHWKWDVLGALAWIALLFLVTEKAKLVTAILQTIPFPLLIFAAYIAAFRGPLTNQILRNRWMVTIGGMCYTEYLYHQFLLHMVQARLGMITSRLLIQLPLFLGITVLFSSVMFILFEKPFMYKDWHIQAKAWSRNQWARIRSRKDVCETPGE